MTDNTESQALLTELNAIKQELQNANEEVLMPNVKKVANLSEKILTAEVTIANQANYKAVVQALEETIAVLQASCAQHVTKLNQMHALQQYNNK